MKNLFIYLFIATIFFACSSKEIQTNNAPETLDIQLDNLVNQIINSLSENNKVKIGVIEFSDIQGNVSNLGRYIAEELTTRLYRTNRFNVVERQMMNRLLEEQNLSTHGYIDINSETGIGKVLGLDAIVSGSITDLGAYIKINARLISPESGKVFSVASVKIIKDDTIKILLNQKVDASKIPIIGISKQNENIIEKDGIIFELLKAQLIGRIASVQIKLTNKSEDDKELRVIIGFDNKKFATMIYDDLGNESILSGIKLANNYRDLRHSVTQYDGNNTKIIAGNSVNMELQFDKVSSKAERISLLQINCSRKIGMVELRNILLKK